MVPRVTVINRFRLWQLGLGKSIVFYTAKGFAGIACDVKNVDTIRCIYGAILSLEDRIKPGKIKECHWILLQWFLEEYLVIAHCIV